MAGGFDTPGKLRATRALLVVICVLSGVIGAVSAQLRSTAVAEIEQRSEPLNADAVEVYRSLANADAIVVSEFLEGELDAAVLRERYDEAVARAAASLVSAATRGGERGLTADRIADIAVQLPVYTSLVEQARASEARSEGDGIAALQRASELMQSTVLPRAQALQRNESERLDDRYDRAQSVPVIALTMAAASLALLIAVQVFLMMKTKRMVNVGLGLATVIISGTVIWWLFALRASHPELSDSRRHSESVTDALGQAQIAARQARASEILALVSEEPRPYERDYLDRMQRLVRGGGVGGALGAARHLSPEIEGSITTAVAQARAWRAAHAEVRALRDEGRRLAAVELVVRADGQGTAKSFNDLDATLAVATGNERAAFKRDIEQAKNALAGLPAGAGMLPLLAAGCAAWGIRERLREYPNVVFTSEIRSRSLTTVVRSAS